MPLQYCWLPYFLKTYVFIGNKCLWASSSIKYSASIQHCLILFYLSSVGCHCNAAGYFIDMPGPGAGDGGDWYCDANFVNNQW